MKRSKTRTTPAGMQRHHAVSLASTERVNTLTLHYIYDNAKQCVGKYCEIGLSKHWGLYISSLFLKIGISP